MLFGPGICGFGCDCTADNQMMTYLLARESLDLLAGHGIKKTNKKHLFYSKRKSPKVDPGIFSCVLRF